MEVVERVRVNRAWGVRNGYVSERMISDQLAEREDDWEDAVRSCLPF